MLPLIFRKDVDVNQMPYKGWIEKGMNPYVAKCIANRGVSTEEEAFQKNKLIHWKELKGIEKASDLISNAIIRNEKMTIVADYDCDGATACAILLSGIKALGGNIDFVVPNRFVHGYGLTPSVVDEVVKRGKPNWIVTVDNGIASIQGIEHANSLGIGVIVTDHHLPGDVLPNPAAMVNPNQPGCMFPSKNIAGCGVAYYVLAATQDSLKKKNVLVNPINLSEWLDLVALGTVADVVKLDENNRWLVKQGLIRIRMGLMRPGIAALFKAANADYKEATAQTFGFGLGPRLNAAGRLEDMTVGIRCLMANSFQEAWPLAQQLDGLNEKRKQLEKEMKEEAWAQIDLSNQKNKASRVVFHKDYHEGVIGIVAGRIKEVEHTPTIVFAKAQEEGLLKGSGRSIQEVHLRDAIDWVYKKSPDIIHKFGGHSMAAGLTIKEDKFDEFQNLFEESVLYFLDGTRPSKSLLVDGVLNNDAFNVEVARELSQEVWGQGFDEPLWYGEFEVLNYDFIGKEKNHLKMNVCLKEGGDVVECIHFFTLEPPSDLIKMVYRLGYKTYRDNTTVSLQVVDRENL